MHVIHGTMEIDVPQGVINLHNLIN
jgi:hypothetical protein